MEAIYNRRNIRNYQKKKVEEDVIIQLLKSVASAPSVGMPSPGNLLL